MKHIGRLINKRILCRHHRQVWYERSLDRLMHGKAKPEDVAERFKKLREVRK